ncbi:cupin domain-containing protein [Halieaceae bacterium IMCC8485]|uniref:Cupin domain-containing protein n=1 Tax=Candidatus Seongchinamella marina TaxID=2518990 RepID=A0ABT3SZ11_9GAMM|nr:cupin domain-containing protein [Candidatus Seongchinamella marina]MCX2975234.1 cupin domain-containing protein [Candidatus Seongchinamella marina]
MNYPDRETIIEKLQLEAHTEGGYFRRTFQADHREKIASGNGPRYTLTSIYYLLTAESPVGHWHLNQSDIIHYFHLGSPINYYLIEADGRKRTATLGPDLAAGQQLQLTVPGGTWKASHLSTGDYGLISEAVSPGFEYEDMCLAKAQRLISEFPQHQALIEAYT